MKGPNGTRLGAVLAIVLGAMAIGGASAQADVKVAGQDALPPGVTLTPEEQATATAVIVTAPGSPVVAKVTPKGCKSPACAQVIASSVDANANIAADSSIVVPLRGAKARKLARLPGKQTQARTSAVYGWGYVTDQQCSNYGCWAWKHYLTTNAYWDGVRWAWGTYSRYGFRGDIGCGQSGAGYSVERQECVFHNDPSASDLLYGSGQVLVSGVYSGFPIYATRYLHRHYAASGSSWLVAG